jgi:uncharacterized phage protein gp47/JayE
MSTNPFAMSFDTILNAILTDFQNENPDVDVSKGSLNFMKAVGYASATWGLYRYGQWIADQIFPDTADAPQVQHIGWIYSVMPTAGESDADFLARVLARIRQPPAGGNQYDYVNWAKEVTDVAYAACVPLGQGLGTVDVVILANPETTGNEIPTQSLLNAVLTYIQNLCPTSVKYLRVLAPTVITQNVTMATTGANKNPAQTQTDITTYMKSLLPGRPLALAKLSNIAINDGADDATTTIPPASVEATPYQLIRPGAISVT